MSFLNYGPDLARTRLYHIEIMEKWRPLRDYTSLYIHIIKQAVNIYNYEGKLSRIVISWASAQIQTRTNLDKVIPTTVRKRPGVLVIVTDVILKYKNAVLSLRLSLFSAYSKANLKKFCTLLEACHVEAIH